LWRALILGIISDAFGEEKEEVTQLGRGVIEYKLSTDVESPPPPPRQTARCL